MQPKYRELGRSLGAVGIFVKVIGKKLETKLLKDHITLIAEIYSFRARDVNFQRYGFHFQSLDQWNFNRIFINSYLLNLMLLALMV